MRRRQLFNVVSFKMNHYQQLGLSEKCLAKDIKKQYLKLAKIYHPDIYKGDDKERFSKIKDAYDVLRIPEKRKKYDMELRGSESDKLNEEVETKAGQSYKFYKSQEQNEHSQEMYDQMEQKVDQQEYQKFRSQKIKVKPDQIHVSEDQMLRQLNQKERLQYEFTHFKNNKEMYYLKYSHQNSYDEILKDNIQMMNEMSREKKVNQAKRQAYFEGYMKYVLNGGLFLFVVITLPALVSISRTKRDMQKERERQNRIAEQKNQMMQMINVQSRIVFD